jgi:hypothetical protein
VDRVLKKVEEGVEEFDEIWGKVFVMLGWIKVLEY